MIAAIMQPYFLPYIGYFQLMRAVDLFIFLDDVQYIDRGWVNRNRIRVNGTAKWLTLPVIKAGRTLAINQRRYVLGDTVTTAGSRLDAAYRQSAWYGSVAPFLAELMAYRDDRVSAFNGSLLRQLASAMGVDCAFATASALGNPKQLRAEDRIIDLCRSVGATHYVNPIGGLELYSGARFFDHGISLSFLRTTSDPVVLDGDPVHLSVVDLLMHEGFAEVGCRMADYELISIDSPGPQP